jgi:2-methylisocitrate lyase-like PEP mutase family enzyme
MAAPDRYAAFRALHERDGAFIIPNPSDVGGAKMLASIGFQAIATTSAGMAFAMGMRDNTVARDDVLAHCRALAAAVEIPVNADLGNCFGDDAETVAETFRLVVQTGVAGASVEDMKDDGTIYERGLAVERVRAACDAVRVSGVPVMVTARTENFLAGRRDLDDTIARLQAFAEAGADVLYAPGITTRDEIAAVVKSVGRPVNVLAGMPGMALTFDDLQSLGVKRISVGSMLARAAIGAFVRAAREMREQGTFTFAEAALPTRDINALLR